MLVRTQDIPKYLNIPHIDQKPVFQPHYLNLSLQIGTIYIDQKIKKVRICLFPVISKGTRFRCSQYHNYLLLARRVITKSKYQMSQYIPGSGGTLFLILSFGVIKVLKPSLQINQPIEEQELSYSSLYEKTRNTNVNKSIRCQ